MKNADLPAMPFVESDSTCSIVTGLTKRETFAMRFHAALLTAQNQHGEWTGVSAGAADLAVIEADALLAALDKSEAV